MARLANLQAEQQVDREEETGIMVLQMTCRDSSSLTSVGQYSKETKWKLAESLHSAPVELSVRADKKVISGPEIGITWDGERVFPAPGSSAKGRLKEDMQWEFPLSPLYPGLGVDGRFQMWSEKPPFDRWLRATIQDQNEDGTLSVFAQLSLADGKTKEIHFPSVSPEHLQEVDSQKPLQESSPVMWGPVERALVLDAPKDNPLGTTVSVNGGPSLTKLLARPTPPPVDVIEGKKRLKKSGARVTLVVSMDRSRVTADVGHNILEHFLSGQPRAVSCTPGKLATSWTVQLGPFAQHIIRIEKKTASSKTTSITVDGELLLEAAAEDLGSREGLFECSFRLLGEKHVDWEVHESGDDGRPLASRELITKKTKCSYAVHVSLREAARDLSVANLQIDRVPYSRMFRQPEFREDTIVCHPSVLFSKYNLRAPYTFKAWNPMDEICQSVSNVSLTMGKRLGWDAQKEAARARFWASSYLPAFCCDTSAFVACTDAVDDVPLQVDRD